MYIHLSFNHTIFESLFFLRSAISSFVNGFFFKSLSLPKPPVSACTSFSFEARPYLTISSQTLGGIAAFTLPDVLQNIVVDYVYQLQLIQVGNQEELDKNSLAIVGLTSMLVPALATFNLGFTKGFVSFSKVKD